MVRVRLEELMGLVRVKRHRGRDSSIAREI
jgi:hypothetical protein